MATIPPVSDPRFEQNYEEPYEPKPKRSGWATCLIGCLVTLGVLFVIGAVATFWVARNLRGIASDFASQVIKQGINSSDLAPQEKIEINEQVDRVTIAYRAGRLSNEQLGRIMQKIAESPLMTSVMVAAVDRKYFANSGLSDEEKTAGRITLQRFVRGMIDKKIGEQASDDALKHVATKEANGNWQIRQRVSDAELRAFLDAAKKAADEAGVAEVPPDFDPSDEFKRIIDQELPPGSAEPAVVPEAVPEGAPVAIPDASAEPAK